MKQILLPFLALIFMACSTSENLDVTGKWNISSAMGISTLGGDNPAFINFERGGHMNGNATVNLFNGSYSLKGNQLQLSNIGMTRMMGGSMQMEDAITEALNTTALIAIADNEAYVLNANNDTIMHLVREGAEIIEDASADNAVQLVGAYDKAHALNEETAEIFRTTYDGQLSLTPFSVSEQVVAGMNYAYNCKDDKGALYTVVIYVPLPNQGEPRVTSVEKADARQ